MGVAVAGLDDEVEVEIDALELFDARRRNRPGVPSGTSGA